MNRLLIFLFIHSFVFAFTFAACPQGTIPSMSDNSTCFLFSSNKKSFLIAEQYCNQQGGHLASIHDAFDNTLIRENAQQNFTDSTTADFWVGLNDIIVSGVWTWIDGTSLGYYDWDKGQPDNIPGHDCGAVKLVGGRWISNDCDSVKPFVCSIKTSKPTPTPTPTPQKPCPDTWQYFSRTEACYKSYAQDYDWSTAEQACSLQDGAHLASIHSLEENDFVADVLPFDNHGCSAAWIGLYSVTHAQNWQWTDNSPFNFSLWAPGKPVGYTTFCGAMWDGATCNGPLGTWVDGYCPNTQVPYYVCKKPAHHD